MKKILFLLVALLLLGGQAQAQDTLRADSVYHLEAVVVTYQAEKTTPITFQNMYAKEIKLRSVGQEPSFLLSETPSITVYSDAGNSQGYSYFRMRGIDQTRINITLDGVPLNEPEDQGAYFSNYPDILNSVSKLQIQRGVGTTKNGVASYGGSVQLFSPGLYGRRANFGLGYGSFNSLRAFAEYNHGVKKNTGLYVRGSEIYSQGYKYNSANHSQSIFLSSGLLHEKSTWTVNVLAGRQQNQMAWLGVSDSLINLDRRTNANSNEKDAFIQCLGQLQNNRRVSRVSWLQSSVYYTFLKGNYDFNLNNFLGLPTTDEMYNYAFQSHLVGLFSNYRVKKKHLDWTMGIHGNTYRRMHIGSERTFGQLYENTGYKDEISAFSKVEYVQKKWTGFADVQYRSAWFDYQGGVELPKMNWQFLNPKAGFSVSVQPDFLLYYSIGSTGREPTRNDIFGGNDDLLADSLGNPLLFIQTPERVVDHELGLRRRIRNTFVQANLYYMDFHHEIVLNGKFGPNGLALTNDVDRSFRTGVECNVQYELSKTVRLVNNSSFNYSRIREQTEVFTPILTPPLIVNQEVVYQLERFQFAVSGRYQAASWMDFANTSTLKSYFLLNARAHYEIKGLQFSLFANNLTNAKYFNNGYVDYDGSKKYFVQAPLNVYGAVRYSF